MPIKFDDKLALLNYVKGLVDENNDFETSSLDIQNSIFASIESLWQRDGLVSVNADDSTLEDLESKIVSGTNITLNVIDSGGVKTLEVSAPSVSTTDELVKVNNADSTPNYLDQKITGGTNVSVNVIDTFGVKTLEVSAPSVSTTDESLKVSADDTTANYLENKIVAGDNIDITTLNPGANETLELSVILPALDVFYVDGNNPNTGTGSILDPYQTIDAAVAAVGGSRVNIVVRGYDSYSVTTNLWVNANFVFERGAIVTAGAGLGVNALFDEVSAGVSTFIPHIYGQINYTGTGKGFFHTGARTSTAASGIDAYVSFQEIYTTDAIAISLGSCTTTQRFQISGDADGGRGYIELTSSSIDLPLFKSGVDGNSQFGISDVFFRDRSGNNGASSGIIEIGDQPFGQCELVNIKTEMIPTGGAVAPKANHILLEGNGDKFLINGLEIVNNVLATVLNISTSGGTYSSFSFRNIFVDMFAQSGFLMKRSLAQTPEFIVSNILSSVPFNGNIANFIDEASSGLITVDGVSYVPNSDLRQITQTAPTVASQYANKQYVDDSVLKPTTTTTASTANLGFDVDTISQASVTAQATALQIDAPTGTPVDGQEIRYRIKDDGTSRAIDWNTAAAFNNTGVAPASTTINKNTYVRAIYDANTSLYDIVETIVLT